MSGYSTTTFYDFANWSQHASPRNSSISSSHLGSDEGAGLSFWDPDHSPVIRTPLTSPPSSNPRYPAQDHNASLDFSPPLAFSFTKGSRLFKLRYAHLDVCKDAAGSMRCIELSDPAKQDPTSIHTFPGTQIPIPHLEQPYVASQRSTYRVCFLEEQMMQTAQTLFQAKPDYTFDHWADCIRFQEAILAQSIIFVGGVAEIKSKGRGEECISQNLRVLRSRSGRQTMLFFANSQRKERKRYTSIGLDAVEAFDPGKKATRPVMIKLRPVSEQAAQMKALQIQFLDELDRNTFLTVLQQGCDVR